MERKTEQGGHCPDEGVGRGRKIISVIAACAGAVLIVLATAIACIEAVAFSRDFYVAEYKKLDTAAYVGVDEDTLWRATDTLLAYLEGGRDNLDMEAEIDGAVREYYSDREKTHMVDVAVLNRNAVFFMQVAYPLGAVLLLCAFMAGKTPRLLLKSAFFSILGVLAGFGVLGVWAAADFGSFWVNFHHIFFTNDLWVLDPATSLMIRMFEQTFFFDMVAQILGWSLGILAAALVLTGVGYRKLEKRCRAQA